MILKWNLRKLVGSWWTGFICFTKMTNSGLFEGRYEPFGSIEFWKFVDRLRNYEIFKQGCPSWIYLVV
jgi:hypothetical protein